jgi:predicted SAM-dependent methyltransferase
MDASYKALLAKHPCVADVLHRVGVLSESDRDAAHEWSSDIVRHDVTDGLPFDRGAVDYLYSSHMLEHLEPDAAREFCEECYRVLADGGWVRIVVPDLEELAERYFAGDEAFFENETGPMADRFLQKSMLRDFHRWAYDAESLKHRLVQAGFDEAGVFKRSYGEGEVPDLDVVETHEPPKSVYVEARK